LIFFNNICDYLSMQEEKANTSIESERTLPLFGMKETDWDLLLRRIDQGKCTPFLGAGACWPHLPLSSQIAQDLAKKYDYPLPDIDNLPRVAQFLAIERRDAIFPKEIVIDILRGRKTPDFTSCELPHSVLAELPLPMYLTTNYDDFMIQALRQRRKEVEKEYCRWNRFVSKEPPLLKKDFQPTVQKPLVYYLHGIWDVAESLVLTEDDYFDFLVNVSENINYSLHHRVRRSLTGTSLLFIGYRLEDLSFRTIFRGLINQPEKNLRRTSISVQLPPGDEHLRSLKNSIKRLERFIADLVINDDESKAKISQSINKLKDITDQPQINKSNKNLLYPEVNFLESQLYQLSIQNSEKKYFVNIINLLQESMGLLPTSDEQRSQEDAVRFLEEYYKEMDIRIFWGNAQQFVTELRERWEAFERRNVRNDN